jgi:hypothetical protein
LNGQWIGGYTDTGSNAGSVMINIDDIGKYYEGEAYFINSKGLPTTFAQFRTPDKSTSFKLEKHPIFPVNPVTNQIDSWDNVKKIYNESVFFSKYVNANGEYDGEWLKLNWKTEHGLDGSCQLRKSQVNKPSNYKPFVIDWTGYKKFLDDLKLEPQKYIFRGQEETWRLQTNFHRTGRANLARFINQDRIALHRNLSSRTKHIFDIEKPDQNGAFMNLVQHHGMAIQRLCLIGLIPLM